MNATRKCENRRTSEDTLMEKKEGKKFLNLFFSESDKFIGGLIFHFLQVAHYNIHQISQIESWNVSSGVNTAPIGFAINPTLALINHSCYPNVVRVNLGVSTAVVACRNIRKGEEVADSYSVQFQVKWSFYVL